MAEALGFDPPAGLIEQTPQEEILPLDEPGDSEGDGNRDDVPNDGTQDRREPG
jgi:hypothetical protein